MWHLILQYLTVLGWSGTKFMLGVAACLTFGLHPVEQAVLTFVGGTAGATLFTLFGVPINRWIRRQTVRWKAALRRRREARDHRREVRTPSKPKGTPSRFQQWAIRRFGLPGIAFLTPPILSVPIGTAMALALGATPRAIVVWMALAMLFWSVLFAAVGPPLITAIESLIPPAP